MSANLNPYLLFDGQAKEAMEFYRDVFGGELTATTFADGGMPHEPADGGKIMHSQLDVDGAPLLMGADNPDGTPPAAVGTISISLSGDDEGTLRGWWDKLSDGGTVLMPLEKAPWGDWFGQCTDRYGFAWMVNITGSAS